MANILELIEKAEIEVLDKKAKSAGFIIAVGGELYTKSISKHSAVYIELIGYQWQAWRETYKVGKANAVSIKILHIDVNFEYVLLKATRYFDNIVKRGYHLW